LQGVGISARGKQLFGAGWGGLGRRRRWQGEGRGRPRVTRRFCLAHGQARDLKPFGERRTLQDAGAHRLRVLIETLLHRFEHVLVFPSRDSPPGSCRTPEFERAPRDSRASLRYALKMRMGATHFLMKRLPKVATEMALHVLAYKLTRVMNILGVKPLIAAIQT
jgi:hypothetical protein